MRTTVSTKGQTMLPAELRWRNGISPGQEFARRAGLERWFERGIGRIQCVPWDSAVGLRWAQLLGDLRRPAADPCRSKTA
jgi:hypothetical protein